MADHTDGAADFGAGMEELRQLLNDRFRQLELRLDHWGETLRKEQAMRQTPDLGPPQTLLSALTMPGPLGAHAIQDPPPGEEVELRNTVLPPQAEEPPERKKKSHSLEGLISRRGNSGLRARKTREQRQQMMEAYAHHFEDTKWRLEEDAGWSGRAMRLTMSPWFDTTIGLVILFNAVCLGAQVQIEALYGETVEAFYLVEVICSAIFAIEIVCRFMAHGCMLWHRAGWAWVGLDIVLVGMSIVDLCITIAISREEASKSHASVAKVLKFVRMARVMRVVRMFRMVGELRLMMQMITTSLTNLFSLIMVLVLLIYCFAIALTKGAVDFIQNGDGPSDLVEKFQRDYGTLPRSMYSLFLSMTGGVNWSDVTTPWLSVNYAYFLLMVIFVSFSMFSVLNIVTGVFVDGAIEMAKRDRLSFVEKEAQMKQAIAFHLLELLEEIDEDGTGTITTQEFTDALRKDEVKRFMEALHIEGDDALELFSLLDQDADGSVDVYEFVEGMQRLKGEAKSADVHRLAMDMKAVQASLQKIVEELSRVRSSEQWYQL